MTDEFAFESRMGDSLDLTPIIDVVFLLLIFFIMATTFMKPAVNVLLPSAASSGPVQKNTQTIVTIDAHGDIHVDGTAATPEDLPKILARHPERPLTFMVDRGAPFQAFMGVLDQARLQNRNDFNITTEKVDARQP